MSRRSGSSAVEKTLAVLDALGDHERIADIAQATGLHKSTVHRILQDFARLGFATVTEQGTYQGGARILGLAGRVLARTDAAERARPRLAALQAVAAPEHVAQAVLGLLGMDLVTGEDVVVDAGRWLQY